MPLQIRQHKPGSWPAGDLTNLLVRVEEMARDLDKARPEACQAVKETLAWADQVELIPGGRAAAAMEEIRRLIRETPHLRDRV
jgi:hypothetical protein